MSRLLDAYRAVHEQGFIPIFVEDHFPSRILVEACLEAGCTTIEYTQRRKDSREMIPWIRKTYPDTYLLVGSTLDSDRIVANMRRRHPQLMTLGELAEHQVDGFVSMLGWTQESIRRYAPSFLVAPTAMTVTEALQQSDAGAHFNKLSGGDLGFVRRVRNDAAFEFCPVLVTGGATAERMDEIMAAGAIATASGFDLILKGQPPDVPKSTIVAALKHYIEATKAARRNHYPGIAPPGSPTSEWLESLPHFHPFQTER